MLNRFRFVIASFCAATAVACTSLPEMPREGLSAADGGGKSREVGAGETIEPIRPVESGALADASSVYGPGHSLLDAAIVIGSPVDGEPTSGMDGGAAEIDRVVDALEVDPPISADGANGMASVVDAPEVEVLIRSEATVDASNTSPTGDAFLNTGLSRWANVCSGEEMHSSNFILIATTGESPGANEVMSSLNYSLRVGFVQVTQ